MNESEQQKLALILHLARCVPCRRDAHRRMAIRHPLRQALIRVGAK